jgi:Na+-translocating ferredoxin:NAD+ oxidoreductase RnfG subunit
MINGHKLESAGRSLAFILLIPGIMVFILTAYASESTNPAITAADEKIATFNEDVGAASDSEHAENVSSLLHAKHFQAPIYLPQRQKRFVASHTWVHIVPFAVLVMLALATTRFFGKRGRKTTLPGNGAASEKVIIGVGLFLIIAMTAGVAGAQTTIPVKDAVVSLLGDASKIYQKDMELAPDVKRVLKQKLYWEPKESSIKVYYSKEPNGTVEAYAFVLSDTLMQCGGRHKYCVKVSSKGQVQGVKVIELSCYRSFAVSNERFLDKFKSMNTTNADKMHIDAITGATISSKLTVMVVRRALALFELLKGSAND